MRVWTHVESLCLGFLDSSASSAPLQSPNREGADTRSSFIVASALRLDPEVVAGWRFRKRPCSTAGSIGPKIEVPVTGQQAFESFEARS